MTPSWPHRYEPGWIWHLAQKNGIGFIIMWLLWINGEPLSRKAMPERQKVPKRVTHRGRGLTATTSQLGGHRSERSENCSGVKKGRGERGDRRQSGLISLQI